MPLIWQIHTRRGAPSVEVCGEPDQRSATALAAAVDHHLACGPGYLTVDLAGLSSRDDAAPIGWSLLLGRIGAMSGSTLLLCRPDLDDAMSGLDGGALSRALTCAVEATTVGPPGFSDQILPVSGGARHGRNMATEACLAWDLPHNVGTAALVASELLSNMAVQSTLMTLTVLRHRGLCYISVGGGHAYRPRLADRGTASYIGFLLINALADHWGCLPHDDGNLVWAALPAGAPAS
jgi:hypothetical protein